MRKIITLDSKNIKRLLTESGKNIILGFGIIISGFLFYSGAFADNVDYTVNVAPSLNVSVSSSSVVLDLNPNTKTSDSKDITVTVGTNNITGYKLNMSTTGDITSLTRDSSADGKTASIPTLGNADATGTTAADLTDNRWGYRLNNTGNFIPYVSGVQIMEKNIATNADTATLSFASKINYSQAAGSYNINLNFLGTVNPLCDTTITGYMQTFSPCPDMAIGTSGTLTDARDGKSYTAAKLADGNFWLLENLRLDISSPSVQAKLTSATTNATDETLNYLKNGGGSGQYPANGVIAKTASSGSWTNDYANPYIATEYENTIQPASGPSPAGKIGIYYNYCAASAGSYCYASGAGTGDASQDICPSGWRMPTGGASGEYQALFAAYSSNVANFQSALSTPFSGCFYNGTTYYQGTNGYFWSSTRDDGNYMYRLRVDSSTVYPQNYYYRDYGFSVRCILK